MGCGFTGASVVKKAFSGPSDPNILRGELPGEHPLAREKEARGGKEEKQPKGMGQSLVSPKYARNNSLCIKIRCLDFGASAAPTTAIKFRI